MQFNFRSLLTLTFLAVASLTIANGDECHLTPVIHVLQYPGCTPKPIPSFACTGRCTSYVQVKRKHLLSLVKIIMKLCPAKSLM